MGNNIEELLKGNSSCTLSEFAEAMPGIPRQTVVSRVRALRNKGVVFAIGGGNYVKGCKMKYSVKPSALMKEICSFLISTAEGVDFCLYELETNLFVEVRKTEMHRIATILKLKYGKVALFNDVAGNLELLSGCIIVKQLISGSALLDMDGIPVPAIEKILVDMVADADRLILDEHTIQKSFQRAFEIYEINRTRMMRYAGRRNREKQVQEYVSNLDFERINLFTRLQTAIARQPIERAWLFGSFARGEEGQGSDIDLLVDFRESAHVSVIGHTRAALSMGDYVGKEIDLVTNGTVLPSIEPFINKDKYLIYERAHS